MVLNHIFIFQTIKTVVHSVATFNSIKVYPTFNILCLFIHAYYEKNICSGVHVSWTHYVIHFLLLQELNDRWRSLQQLAEERSQLLGSAHEVQRFHRYITARVPQKHAHSVECHLWSSFMPQEVRIYLHSTVSKLEHLFLLVCPSGISFGVLRKPQHAS